MKKIITIICLTVISLTLIPLSILAVAADSTSEKLTPPEKYTVYKSGTNLTFTMKPQDERWFVFTSGADGMYDFSADISTDITERFVNIVMEIYTENMEVITDYCYGNYKIGYEYNYPASGEYPIAKGKKCYIKLTASKSNTVDMKVKFSAKKTMSVTSELISGKEVTFKTTEKRKSRLYTFVADKTGYYEVGKINNYNSGYLTPFTADGIPLKVSYLSSNRMPLKLTKGERYFIEAAAGYGTVEVKAMIKPLTVKTVTENVVATAKANGIDRNWFRFIPETTGYYEIGNTILSNGIINAVMDSKFNKLNGDNADFTSYSMPIKLTSGKTYYICYSLFDNSDKAEITIKKLSSNSLQKGKTTSISLKRNTDRIWFEYTPTESEDLVLYTTGAKSKLSVEYFYYKPDGTRIARQWVTTGNVSAPQDDGFDYRPYTQNDVFPEPKDNSTDNNVADTYYFQKGATYFICVYPDEYGNDFVKQTIKVGLRKAKRVDGGAKITNLRVSELSEDGTAIGGITLKVSLPKNSASKPTDYVILCYSYHRYAKPTWDEPYTKVNANGTVIVNMGNDSNARELTLMLVSAETSISSLGNYNKMEAAALDIVKIERDTDGNVKTYRPER